MRPGIITAASDPEYVHRQYATEAGLAARKAVYADTTGPDVHEIALAVIREAGPTRVLEVGCGEGELAARIGSDPGVAVVAVDQSERMVDLTRARGVDARVADVQDLPFADAVFDVVVAAWMLYHVPDLDRGVSEIARVLRPGGQLVAVTNRADHLAELLALADIGHVELRFAGENGEDVLRRHFGSVRSILVDGTVVFPAIDAVKSYYGSSERLAAFIDQLPAALDAPLVARRCPVVFVAEKLA